MTQRLLQCLFLSSLLSLAGCGHMLASMESNTIEEDQGERTWGRLIEDDSIETKARVNIHAADEAFDNAHLNIVSYNGYVLLVGQVASEALKSKATDVVREIRGVRRIYNELEISAPSSGMTRTSDTWITTKVKSFLLGNTDIQGNRVKVVTENGVVYLMGLATREEAERIAAEASDIGGVQKVVKLFELID
ncbi:phospholipid-binding protein [Halioglobus japonicus]|uniref:BON domain-containing protein n=1 Tax=Halioglobus japonicus TaxID=930805 RepID=A0AAP8MG42_9GAMM|nr:MULTISPECIES: BON domain-containing protein [Halioglobus]AQA19788.1 phospholipid-binding protein [Halioglobus japonicus]KZX59508.1 phospholipid-binding protein [Halioglobus sp. HI00S01]PLW87140.1 BON domain-containing protein [Halioglobus japonicus]GHD10014.1 BON domain-containing protein [Halioglobus japonicus]